MSYSDYHDDFITARNITPPLERVDPRYRHESTPPPLVSADESDSVCSIGERSHKGDDGIVVGSRSASKPTHQRQKRRKRHHGRQSRPPLLGNEVLLMNLAPGRPDIVRELAQTDLNSGSDEEGEESEDERGTRNGDRVDHAQFQHVRDEPRRRPMTNGHANDGVDYMDLDDEEDFSDTQKSSIPETSRSMSHQSTVNSSSVNGIAQPHALVGSPTDFSASRAPLNLLPPPLPLNRLSPRSPLSIDPRQVKEEENETSVISPNLGGFLISSADGNPDDMLPPISPPRSVTEFSFDILTRLPSLQTTIDMEMMGSPRSYSMSAGSPTHWHPYGASPLPFSAPSPGYSYPTPGASMQAKHHPFRTRENSTGMAASSEPSDYSISTPNSVATPATSVSTSSYATSIGIKSEYQHQRTISQPMLVAHHHAWQSPTEPFQTRDINGFHAPPWKPDSQAIGQKRKTAPLLPTLSTSSRTSTAAEPSSKLKSACKTESKTSSPNRDPSRALTAKTTISPVDTTGPSNELPSASSSHNNIYRCTFPTCTAAPFGTQYLLNSHANVHSFSRPHYCSEPGCNRGPGGMGFKRKNEMIRHASLQSSSRHLLYLPAPFSHSTCHLLN